MWASIVPLLLAATASAKQCTNATVPVTISARNGVFGGLAPPQTNLEVTTFVQNVTQQGHNFTQTALTGYNTIQKTYKISTTYCKPDGYETLNPVIQVLTHGIGFDASYWDLSYNNYNYSYVDRALKAGYHTLTYDRLGIAKSQHGDPLNEIQSFLEAEALHALTQQLAAGKFPGVSHSFGKNIVAVGHSFGSAQSALLGNNYPDSVAALVLTGFSTNSSFMSTFLAGGHFQQASLNDPKRFGQGGQNLPKGYIVSDNAETIQLQFFYPGAFDPKILQLAQDTKQPATTGEILTIGSQPKPNNFAGPVFVITGQEDVPFCGGDCLITGNPSLPSIPAAVKMAFPKVSTENFAAYVQPKSGHGINLHYNATGAYDQITKFLKSHNIVSK